MINSLKDFLQRKKELVWTIFIHVGLLLASIGLSYNSFKEYVRMQGDIFPQGQKVIIKATFPWSIIIFMVLYLINAMVQRGKGGYPSIWQYIIIFGLQAIIINLIFFSKDISILIVQNLAILYFATFILALNGTKKIIFIDEIGWAEEFLPPIIYKFLKRNMPMVREYFKRKSSAPFITGFITLLIVCTIFLIFKQESAAEDLANIAYFLLMIGVGIELYQFVKHGERDDKE